MKKFLYAGLFVLLVSLSSAAHATVIVNDFTGPYDPGNWTAINSGNGVIDTTGTPGSISMTSSNDGSFSSGNQDFTISIPASGWISFDWSYTTTDWNPVYDPFGYLLNGSFHQLTLDWGNNNQSGSELVSVSISDVFGFRSVTTDNLFGSSTTVISEFSGPDSPNQPIPNPEPTTLLLMGVGVVGLIGTEARRRRKKKEINNS